MTPCIGSLVDTPIRVIIVSGIRVLCEGLSEGLARHAAVTVSAIAHDSDEACAAARRQPVDVALLDASSADLLGLAPVLQRLGVAHVIAFAVGDHDADAIRCAEAGVSAFVGRHASVDELANAVSACNRQELTLSPRLASCLFKRVGTLSRLTADGPRVDLTVREREILGLLQHGLSNREISSRLNIRLPTVKNHVHHLLEKLGLQRREQAAAMARHVTARRAARTH